SLKTRACSSMSDDPRTPTGFKTRRSAGESRVSRGISLDDPRENPGIHGAETPQENTASARDTPPPASNKQRDYIIIIIIIIMLALLHG
ncbi:hypothetical protein M9458_041266, partial [Cirrhinus mrigala]